MILVVFRQRLKTYSAGELHIDPQLITEKTGLPERSNVESLKFLRVILCVEETLQGRTERLFSINAIEVTTIAGERLESG